jgi:hypothetical protein
MHIQPDARISSAAKDKTAMVEVRDMEFIISADSWDL